MRILIALSLALGFAMHVKADETVDMYSLPIVDHMVRPCNFWSRESGPSARGYVCASYPVSVRVPDSRSVQQAIDTLERKIEQLERRVQELEKE
jgi:hypothetical protein